MIPVGGNKILSCFARIGNDGSGMMDQGFIIMLSESHVAGRNLSHVIATACLSGIKKLLHKFENIHASTFQKIEDISNVLLRHIDVICEKKNHKYLCRIHYFLEAATVCVLQDIFPDFHRKPPVLESLCRPSVPQFY